MTAGSEANSHADTAEAPPRLTLVGTDDAGVCIDGVCSIPDDKQA